MHAASGFFFDITSLFSIRIRAKIQYLLPISNGKKHSGTVAMIIDFHTHIFPEAVRQHRESYFRNEPAFELLYDSPRSKLAGAREIISEMDAHGIDCSVVFGFPWKSMKTMRMHNNYILEAVKKYPKRLIGLCCLDPGHPEAVMEANRCLKEGLCGLGELAFYNTGFTLSIIEHLRPLMALCREADVPVLIHTNEPVGHIYPGKSPMTVVEIYRLIQAFPENNIVLAHWGGGLFFFHLLKKEVKAALKNVYVDTAASPYLYDPNIYRIAVDIITPDKILFGSDYPLLPPGRYFDEIRNSGLSPSGIRSITGLNAKRLLKLY
jgi:predicted TIM-barrel fold metal-dependent hydrolase